MPANAQVREIIEQMVRRLVEEYQPEQVILFGSMAYDEPGEESDIDLLIVKETPEPSLDRRVRVRRPLSDPKHRIPFSPLVLTPRELAHRLALGGPFYHKIVGEGQVMYGECWDVSQQL